jgi:hypothetical protein
MVVVDSISYDNLILTCTPNRAEYSSPQSDTRTICVLKCRHLVGAGHVCQTIFTSHPNKMPPNGAEEVSAKGVSAQDSEITINNLAIEISKYTDYIKAAHAEINAKFVERAKIVSKWKWRTNTLKLHNNKVETQLLTAGLHEASLKWSALNKEFQELKKQVLDKKMEREKAEKMEVGKATLILCMTRH